MAEYSVMIIDDNEEDRYLLRRQLKLTGLDLTIFEESDGAHAIAFLKNYSENRERYPADFPPMLLFLDINMPLLDGWGFLEEFSKTRVAYDIKSSVVVMFTTSKRPEDEANASQYDFVYDYVVKGEYTPEQLKKIATSLR